MAKPRNKAADRRSMVSRLFDRVEQDPLFRFFFRQDEDEKIMRDHLLKTLRQTPEPSVRDLFNRLPEEAQSEGVHYPLENTLDEDYRIMHRRVRRKRYVF